MKKLTYKFGSSGKIILFLELDHINSTYPQILFLSISNSCLQYEIKRRKLKKFDHSVKLLAINSYQPTLQNYFGKVVLLCHLKTSSQKNCYVVMLLSNRVNLNKFK